MFWARARKTYPRLTADDPDISRFLDVSSQFQQEGYRGLVGWVQDIGHRWVSRRTRPGRVLEIGFGAGRHAAFFRGTRDDYFVSEVSSAYLDSEMWSQFRERGIQCDASRLPFRNESFSTVISIYNLEHIQELSKVLSEVHRILARDGKFLVALPCEGGLAWNLGRELTTRRQFQKRYRINYDKVIAFEHVWDFAGVQAQLLESRLFDVRRRAFFPFGVPTPHFNLIACLELSPCPDPGSRS